MNHDDLRILNRFTERIHEYFPTAEVRLNLKGDKR